MAKIRQPIDPEKEARIIEVAMHEFAQHGYRDTKTENIATRAAVSKGLIFRYFKSKANLYLTTVRYTFAKINQAADLSVWQDSTDLKMMIVRSLRYKIQMQLQYPDEFALAMQAYGDSSALPEKLQPQVQKIWQDVIADSVPLLVTPILERLPMRPGVDPNNVRAMILALSSFIGEKSKGMIQANPHLKVADFDGIVEQAQALMDIVEHGFLADETKA